MSGLHWHGFDMEGFDREMTPKFLGLGRRESAVLQMRSGGEGMERSGCM